MNKQVILLFMFVINLCAFAGQGKEGGDALEIEFHDIRKEILSWINRGGAQYLEFESRLKYEDYVEKMKYVLDKKNVIVSFTGNEKETLSYGEPKTCVNFVDLDLTKRIVCNIAKYNGLNQKRKFRLIHHEFAALAGIEVFPGANSNYFLSSQITDFLESETVYRLAVKNIASDEKSYKAFFKSGGRPVTYKANPGENFKLCVAAPDSVSLTSTGIANKAKTINKTLAQLDKKDRRGWEVSKVSIENSIRTKYCKLLDVSLFNKKDSFLILMTRALSSEFASGSVFFSLYNMDDEPIFPFWMGKQLDSEYIFAGYVNNYATKLQIETWIHFKD